VKSTPTPREVNWVTIDGIRYAVVETCAKKADAVARAKIALISGLFEEARVAGSKKDGYTVCIRGVTERGHQLDLTAKQLIAEDNLPEHIEYDRFGKLLNLDVKK